jgi:hypothetical protein
VSFDSDEFAAYEIEKEIDITFCLKEFKVRFLIFKKSVHVNKILIEFFWIKVCLTFGNLFDLNLDIFFQRKGR